MDCSTIQQKLAEYAEGSLLPDEMKEIEKHLATCEKCRSDASELKKTIEALKGLDDIPSPPWLTQKVMQKVRIEARSKKRLLRKLFFPLHIKLPIEAVATLLIAGAAVLIMKSMGPDLQPVTSLTEKPQVQTLTPEKETLQKNYTAERQAAGKGERAPAPLTHPEAETSSGQPRVHDQQPVPAPPVAAAPAPPAPVARSFEAGKALDSAAPAEERQKAASGSARSPLPSEKKGAEIPTINLQVKDIKKATQEIETALSKLGGRLLGTGKYETATTLTIHLDPSRIGELMEQLRRIGRIKEPLPDTTKYQEHNLTIIILNQ